MVSFRSHVLSPVEIVTPRPPPARRDQTDKYRRLTKGDISAIADPERKALSEASESVGIDVSGIRRAIIRLRVIVPTKLRNRCGLCRKCRVAALCEGCPFKGEAFSDPVVANSIIDRLVHHSAIIRITGRSYRIKGLMDEEGADAGAADP